MSTAPGIVMIAGGLTFFNEWYQTDKVNWRVPIATFGGAWFVSAIAVVDERAAVGIAVMVLIGASSAKFGGKSVFDEIGAIAGKGLSVDILRVFVSGVVVIGLATAVGLHGAGLATALKGAGNAGSSVLGTAETGQQTPGQKQPK